MSVMLAQHPAFRGLTVVVQEDSEGHGHEVEWEVLLCSSTVIFGSKTGSKAGDSTRLRVAVHHRKQCSLFLYWQSGVEEYKRTFQRTEETHHESEEWSSYRLIPMTALSRTSTKRTLSLRVGGLFTLQYKMKESVSFIITITQNETSRYKGN